MFLSNFIPFLGFILVIAMIIDITLSSISSRFEDKDQDDYRRINQRIEKMAKKMLW